MQYRILLAMLALFPADASRADWWASHVIAECFAGMDAKADQHLFVRVFQTDLGGGKFWNEGDVSKGHRSLAQLSDHPITCTINGRLLRFETVGYRAPRPKGVCGLCDHTGFRLTADEKVIWETPVPPTPDDPIFNGTVDADRHGVTVCIQHRPEDFGITLQLPAEVSDWPPPSILACRSYGY